MESSLLAGLSGARTHPPPSPAGAGGAPPPHPPTGFRGASSPPPHPHGTGDTNCPTGAKEQNPGEAKLFVGASFM